MATLACSLATASFHGSTSRLPSVPTQEAYEDLVLRRQARLATTLFGGDQCPLGLGSRVPCVPVGEAYNDPGDGAVFDKVLEEWEDLEERVRALAQKTREALDGLRKTRSAAAPR